MSRLVLSKGIEFLFSIPVLAIFVVANLGNGAQAALGAGPVPGRDRAPGGADRRESGSIVAPLVVFFRDLERATKLALRFLFYASPIIYGITDLPNELHFWASFNPLAGIFTLYRSAFFLEPARLVRGGHLRRDERAAAGDRHPRVRAVGAIRAEGDLMAGSAEPTIGEPVIVVEDAGIEFKRNRSVAPQFQGPVRGQQPSSARRHVLGPPPRRASRCRPARRSAWSGATGRASRPC